MIDLGLAGDDGFAETEIGGHHHLVELAAYRVDAEADARRACRHQALDDHGHGGIARRQAGMLAIGDGAILPEREEARLHRQEDLCQAAPIQERVVLAGESGIGEILERPGGAHGVRRVELGIQRAGDLVGELGGQRLLRQQGAERGGLLGARCRLEAGERGDALAQIGDAGGEIAIGLGRDEDARRHRQAGGDEPGEACAFASGKRRRLGARITQRQDVTHRASPRV